MGSCCHDTIGSVARRGGARRRGGGYGGRRVLRRVPDRVDGSGCGGGCAAGDGGARVASTDGGAHGRGVGKRDGLRELGGASGGPDRGGGARWSGRRVPVDSGARGHEWARGPRGAQVQGSCGARAGLPTRRRGLSSPEEPLSVKPTRAGDAVSRARARAGGRRCAPARRHRSPAHADRARWNGQDASCVAVGRERATVSPAACGGSRSLPCATPRSPSPRSPRLSRYGSSRAVSGRRCSLCARRQEAARPPRQRGASAARTCRRRRAPC